MPTKPTKNNDGNRRRDRGDQTRINERIRAPRVRVVTANGDQLGVMNTRDALEKAVFHSCRNKAEIVSSDEREQGMRALLNFGHTFGHAIEAGMGYGNWSHGEAVAAGSMMAIELSHMLGWLDKCDVERAEALFSRAGLPTVGPALGVHRYLELMQHDKKVQNGVLRLVLLEKLGSAVVSDRASLAEIERAINARVRCG